MKAIIGKKVGMSQIFDENGHVIPVTVIEAGPCVVVQKKTAEKDGYEAVQLGFEDIAERKLTKPELGHLNKAGVAPKKHLKEFDLENAAELNVGDIVKADTCFHIRASVKLICIDYIWKSKYLWVISGIIFFTQISPYAIK